MGGEKGGGGGGPTLRDFVVERALGTGGSGVVVRARRAGRGGAGGGGGQYVAVKAVSKRELVRSKRRVWFLRREVAIHRLVSKHHGVVALHEVFEDAEGVYMVMELLRGGDLFAQMARLAGRGLAEQVALRVVAQVLEVLAYAHGRGVAHRDIKLENVVFVQPPDLLAGERLRVKVVDWGLACLRAVAADAADGGAGGGEARTSGERVGTLRYCAPEICARARYLPAQCDMWSVGVVLYAMLAHCHPYEGRDEKEMLSQILSAPLDLSGPRWAPVSMDTKILLRRLLSKHAASRPSAPDALAEVARIQAKIARRGYIRPPHVPCATLVRSARSPPPAPAATPQKSPPAAPPPPPPPPPKAQTQQDTPAATQPLDAIGLAFGRFFGGLFKRNEVCA